MGVEGYKIKKNAGVDKKIIQHLLKPYTSYIHFTKVYSLVCSCRQICEIMTKNLFSKKS